MEQVPGAKPVQQGGSVKWPVMILAHNEERHIEACLDSLFRGDPEAPLEAYVMANGCTDQTEAIVRRYGERNPAVHLVSIKLGDKCNAWNEFVHQTAKVVCPDQPIYFFMDGDARAVPGSFSAMARLFDKEPQAHAVSAPPASGRSMAHDRAEMIEKHGLVANLYALRGSFVRRCQDLGVRIPLGLEGDDGLIGILVHWNLDPTGPLNPLLTAVCAEAGFTFESFTVSRPSDLRTYWKRMVRYGRRRYEFAILGPRLKAGGLAAMPRHIRDIYGDADKLSLAWDGVYTLNNWFALREMRRIGRGTV